jgi:hypothetical protein
LRGKNAGFISNPMINEGPCSNDPWTLWRHAEVLCALGSTGAVRIANENLEAVLSNPKTPDGLRKMAEEKKREGWEPPRAFTWKPGEAVPF